MAYTEKVRLGSCIPSVHTRVGERPTYTGYGTELIAGCKDKDGNKLWIKAEYLKNISPIKSPKTKERKKYIKWYIKKNAGDIVMKQAAG